METLTIYFAVVYYGFGIIVLCYDFFHNRKQEKRLAEILDNINKSLDKTNLK